MRGDAHVRFGGAGRGNGPNRETAPRPGPTLLVGGEHEVPLAKAPSLPGAGVEVQDSPGLGAEVGVPGEDPAAVGPRPDRVTIRQRIFPDHGLEHRPFLRSEVEHIRALPGAWFPPPSGGKPTLHLHRTYALV